MIRVIDELDLDETSVAQLRIRTRFPGAMELARLAEPVLVDQRGHDCIACELLALAIHIAASKLLQIRGGDVYTISADIILERLRLRFGDQLLVLEWDDPGSGRTDASQRVGSRGRQRHELVGIGEALIDRR